MVTPGLGRHYKPDDRDTDYHIRSFLPAIPTVVIPRKSRYAWTPPKYFPLNQGSKPHCVAYAGDGLLAAGPITNPLRPDKVTAYQEAQRRDEWPGENYDGTSARGLMRYYRELGLIEGWGNAWDVETLRLWHLMTGRPALTGYNWYSSFDQTTSDGFIKITPTARIRGGHETLSLGWDDVRGAARCMNSHGRTHDKRSGRFWIAGETLERLINEHGDIVTPVELRAP